MAVTASKMQIDIDVQHEKAKAGLAEMGGAVNKTGGLLSTALGTMLGFAGGTAILGAVTGAFGFVSDKIGGTIQAGKDLQAGLAQTAAVIKSTGGAAGVTNDHVSNLADSFQNLYAVDDSVTRGAANMLLTFTNIGSKGGIFDQATTTALDMAQALGQDATQSAMMLGKAINDPVHGMSALQRVGVTFDDQQKKAIKTAMAHKDIMGAQKIMLDELSREFGGSAAAAAGTFDGQMKKLALTGGDLQKQIGTALLPILTSLLTVVTGQIIPAFMQFAPVVQEIWFQAGQLGQLIIEELQPGLDALGFAFGKMGPKGDIVQQMIAKISSVLSEMHPYIVLAADALRDMLIQLAQHLPAIISAAAAFAQWGSPLLIVANHLDAIIPIVSTLSKWLAEHLTPVIVALAPVILSAGKAVLQFAGDIAERCLPIIQRIGDSIQAVMAVIVPIWTFVWPSMAQTLAVAWGVMQGIIQVAWSIISGVIKIGLDLIGGDWKRAWSDVLDMLRGVWDGIVKIVQSIMGDSVKKLQEGVAQFAAIGTNLGNALLGALKDGAVKILVYLGQLGGQMLAKVKGVFGIHSPSKEFHAIGQQLSAGLLAGVQSLDVSSQIAAHLGSVTGSARLSIGMQSMTPNSVTSAGYGGSAAGGAMGTAVLNVDGYQIARAVMRHLPNASRLATGKVTA